ncbi:recombinase RecT [Frateuria aurantia]|uniref:RecT family n=1 Tax=Frateuria aurantia (strain ATCC 33424 / DSM 6220 / KCTC 2777 / LMG 1558 / NBRC 3245 / NCIMB 13370) TaxID=767434 RepID=H8L1U8_FRAAD|nr:recombinase RecT [Frateuria aurantia]AFC86359.1 hypothetical protein Fraau_1972 [Frateuria aurantia DSM 6220]
MSEISVARAQNLAQIERVNALLPTSIGEAMQLAEFMAKSDLLPPHLKGRQGDCLLVVMQAQRWGMDALSVAQCTSVVHGRLCYEGKLVAAALYSQKAIDGRLHYEISGHGQDASIVVTGTPRGTGQTQSVSGSVRKWRTITMKKQDGAPPKRVDNAWDTIPEDMLVYRGTRQWARRYAPEVMLGVQTPDEVDDTPMQTTVIHSTAASSPAIEPLIPYPEEEFSKNFDTWLGRIQCGRNSAEEVIAKLQTKYTLTPGQLGAIRDLETTEAEVVE